MKENEIPKLMWNCDMNLHSYNPWNDQIWWSNSPSPSALSWGNSSTSSSSSTTAAPGFVIPPNMSYTHIWDLSIPNVNLKKHPSGYKSNAGRNNFMQINRQPKKTVPHIWAGKLSTKTHENPIYSTKVFLGGISWDINEYSLRKMFKKFGQVNIEWPLNENNSDSHHKGYAYAIFESEDKVELLMRACQKIKTSSLGETKYFYSYSEQRQNGMMEIVPWVTQDCYFIDPFKKPIHSASTTVFVGGLHGKLTAEALATVMDEMFGGVIYVGIDSDNYHYPTGSARVTFDNNSSFMRAVVSKWIHINNGKINKKLQIDPFLEESLCTICSSYRGQYFCSEISCFRYFCSHCWSVCHSGNYFLQKHVPLMRYSSERVRANNKQKGPQRTNMKRNQMNTSNNYEC